MARHAASVVVRRPVEQVYPLFTHFNDFPKFMHFVHEVTYYDDQRSHWVVDIAGRHAWDAINEGWIPNQQIGWRSTDGLRNAGVIQFAPQGLDQTLIDVLIDYEPPAGIVGNLGEHLGVGKRFDEALQHDLEHFARMVDEAPPGALDPMASTYLFHSDSAAAQGETTEDQNATM